MRQGGARGRRGRAHRGSASARAARGRRRGSAARGGVASGGAPRPGRRHADAEPTPPPAGGKRACDDGARQRRRRPDRLGGPGLPGRRRQRPRTARCRCPPSAPRAPGSAWSRRPDRDRRRHQPRLRDVLPGRGPRRARRRRVHRQQRLRVHRLRPGRRPPSLRDRRTRHGRHDARSSRARSTATKLATIALYRPDGEVAELQEPVGNCATLPPPAPKCDNGKDDDGDGMIDARDAAGTTDPDPGCSATDGHERELRAADARVVRDRASASSAATSASPAWRRQGCGVLKGVWFRPPGTADRLRYKFGDDDAPGLRGQGRHDRRHVRADHRTHARRRTSPPIATCRP